MNFRFRVDLRILTLLGAGLLMSGPGHAAASDGRHDFDFNRGTWITHIQRIIDPTHPPSRVVKLEGTVAVRPVWGGRAQLEEIEADGPDGHWQGLTLFMFDPRSNEWTQTYIGSRDGAMSPALVGRFADGTGTLFAHDSDGRQSMMVRAEWSALKPDSHHFQEDYSVDGGATWSPAFIASLTRAPEPTASPLLASDRSHDFDFDLGTWQTHSKRRLRPLTGSEDWEELDGTTTVEPVWGGRANLAEFKGDGPHGRLELLSLRWYAPAAGQWHLGFATPGAGRLSEPNVGNFKDGRGDFYEQESIDGRTVWVRFSIWPTGPDSARSEQAFSTDGGRSWEVNWINEYTRRLPARTG